MIIPFGCQTHYSILQSLIRPTELVQGCVKNNFKSCVIIDRASLGGSVEFTDECKNSGIKPIIGINLKLENCGRIILIAKNKRGWYTLCKILYDLNISGESTDPPISIDQLKEWFTEDLLLLTGFLESDLFQCQDVDERLTKYKDLFGDNFFISIECINGIYQEVSKNILNKAKELNIGVIPINFEIYLNNYGPEDFRVISTIKDKNTNIVDKKFNIFLNYQNLVDYINSNNLGNHSLIDSLCEGYELKTAPQLPHYHCNTSEIDALRELCRNGWRNKIANNIDKAQFPIYINRIKKELDVIDSAGLAGYFLIVQDYVNKAKEKWLTGAARGSAAGSLVAYLTGITCIDSIKYDLSFERFYNSARIGSLPDIDVDFPTESRQEIIDYIIQKYGKENVAGIATFNKLKGRLALKEVLRVNNVCSFEQINEITKKIPDEAKIADKLEEEQESSIIRWALKHMPKIFKDHASIDENNEISGDYSSYFYQAIRLEDMIKNTSRHAAGIVIAPKPIGQMCPTLFNDSNGEVLVGVEYTEAEKLGLPKMDILGVSCLDKLMMTYQD